MAHFIPFQAPVLIHGVADFDRHFGPIPQEVVDALGRGLTPTTREGTLRVTEFDEDAFAVLLGDPLASMSWGVAVEASQPLRTPCPRWWRHPLRWLRWNPFLVDGTLVTKLKLTDAKLRAGDGSEVVSWEVGG